MDQKNLSKRSTRRDMLKKVGVTSAFVVPTLMTFNTAELRAGASLPGLPAEPNPALCPKPGTENP